MTDSAPGAEPVGLGWPEDTAERAEKVSQVSRETFVGLGWPEDRA